MADEPDPVRSLVHDLRSPLAVVEGFASLIGRGDLSDEQRAEYAQRIADAAGEMRALLDRV
jgi:signal transduction histidine kinase